MLPAHQIGEGGGLRGGARRRRVETALHGGSARDVGQSERFGSRVDPGAPLLRRPSNAREQADVGAEDQPQSLLAGGPRHRLVVDLHRAVEQHAGRFREPGERAGRLAACRVRDGEEAANLCGARVAVADGRARAVQQDGESLHRALGVSCLQQGDGLVVPEPEGGDVLVERVGIARHASPDGVVFRAGGLPATLADERGGELAPGERHREGVRRRSDPRVDVQAGARQDFGLGVPALFGDAASQHPQHVRRFLRVSPALADGPEDGVACLVLGFEQPPLPNEHEGQARGLQIDARGLRQDRIGEQHRDGLLVKDLGLFETTARLEHAGLGRGHRGLVGGERARA